MKKICIALLVSILSMSQISCSDSDELTPRAVKKAIKNEGVTAETWTLFDEYEHTDIGSGNYVFCYPLSDGSNLLIAGPSLEEAPWTVSISKESGEHTILYTNQE